MLSLAPPPAGGALGDRLACLCLETVLSVKLRDVSPLVMTVAEGDVYRILIQLMNDSPKPNLSNVENRNFQLTMSKVFSKSRAVLGKVTFKINALQYCVTP